MKKRTIYRGDFVFVYYDDRKEPIIFDIDHWNYLQKLDDEYKQKIWTYLLHTTRTKRE